MDFKDITGSLAGIYFIINVAIINQNPPISQNLPTVSNQEDNLILNPVNFATDRDIELLSGRQASPKNIQTIFIKP